MRRSSRIKRRPTDEPGPRAVGPAAPFHEGQTVYAKWRIDCPAPAHHEADGGEWHDVWFEPWIIWKIGPKRVLVSDEFREQGYVSRSFLERHGWGIAYGSWNASVAVIYLEVPAEYRRRTLGYKLFVGEPLAILGLEPGQETDERAIHAAYRRLAMQHHPDHGGDPEEFKRVQSAWESLMLRHKIRDRRS